MSEMEGVFVSPAGFVLTPEGYQRLQEELEHLTVVKRSEIAARIRESKEHGEFSEDNNELDEVKFEQAIVENRISDLKMIFAGAQVLDQSTLTNDVINIGNYVTVRDGDRGSEFEVRLVSSIEADPDADYISNESPMGMALFGASVGEKVSFDAPVGKITYEILKIRS